MNPLSKNVNRVVVEFNNDIHVIVDLDGDCEIVGAENGLLSQIDLSFVQVVAYFLTTNDAP